MKQQHTLQPKLRFPEFKDELEIKLISNFANITTGNKDTQNKVENGKFPFFVRSNTIEKIDSYSFDGEAVLTAGDGVGVGKVFHYINDKFDFHQRVYAIYNFKNVSGKFFFQYFSEKFYNRVIKLSAKNSVDSVRKDFISNMPITLPSLPEQQKIADYLSTIDTKINLLEEKKAQLGLYKKAMMQKLFSQEIRFKPSEAEALEAYPEWEEKRLGEVCQKTSSNLSANQIEDNHGIYKLYGAVGLIQMVDFYQEDKPYISIVKDGAGVGRVLLCDEYSSVLGTLDKISPKDSNNLKFIYYLLLNLDFTKYVTGSTIPHIYFKDYSKEKLNIPSLPEQQKIADFLSAIDESIEKVNEQITQTQSFKKAMLQQMFV